MNTIQVFHCIIALTLIGAAALGGILEPWAPQTRFPDSWRAAGRSALVRLSWGNRVVTGAICGMIFLACTCGFAASDLLTTTSLPSVSISKIVSALVAGLVGVRLIRMKISVPFVALWSLLITIIDVGRNQGWSTRPAATVEIKVSEKKKITPQPAESK